MQVFKCHFKAALETVDPDFSLVEWDRLLEQALLTLSILRGSRVNPALCTQEFLYSQFDFNKNPLAPPGTKSITHSKPEKRVQYEFNGNFVFMLCHQHNIIDAYSVSCLRNDHKSMWTHWFSFHMPSQCYPQL